MTCLRRACPACSTVVISCRAYGKCLAPGWQPVILTPLTCVPAGTAVSLPGAWSLGLRRAPMHHATMHASPAPSCTHASYTSAPPAPTGTPQAAALLQSLSARRLFSGRTAWEFLTECGTLLLTCWSEVHEHYQLVMRVSRSPQDLTWYDQAAGGMRKAVHLVHCCAREMLEMWPLPALSPPLPGHAAGE